MPFGAPEARMTARPVADVSNAGIAAFREGHYAAAAGYFRTATEMNPTDAAAFNNLGQALRAAEEIGSAAEAFKHAAGLDPAFPDPLVNLGALAAAAGNLDAAVDCYRQAIARRADYPEAHFNLAVALEALGERDAAEDTYRTALRYRSGYIRALVNLAALLAEEGHLTEAADLLDRSQAIDPQNPYVLNGWGNVLRAQGRLPEAEVAYRAAVGAAPDFGEGRWNLSLIQLARGNFKRGWANYRFRPSADRHRFAIPAAPLANDLSGRRIIVGGEQGLGDELFFLRFVPELQARGAEVVYRPDPKIASICSRIDFLDGRIDGAAVPEIPVAELPYLLEMTSCPPSVRLAPDPGRVDKMRAKLAAAGPGPYLGITYRAGLAGTGTLFKHLPPEALGDALHGRAGTFVSLQRMPAPGETERLAAHAGKPVADFSAVNDDLEDMLALVSVLDEVVGVSNTNMHLRAGIGRPARVLVTHPAEYRWMAEGDGSPWFPEFSLYRQSGTGNWQDALTNLKSDLSK